MKYHFIGVFKLINYAILCGSAPEDYRQKKLNKLSDSLINNDKWHVTTFPNGIDEFMLEYALNNIIDGKSGNCAKSIFLYFCTESPLSDADTNIWLCKNEIRKDILQFYVNLVEKCDVDFQIVYDSDREFVSEEKLGYERVL